MSWTLDFIQKWRRILTWPSVAKYRNCCLEGAKRNETRPLLLRLRHPYDQTVTLRWRGTDGFTFDEVFGDEVYREAVQVAGPCRTIVDLGANVGLASIYLLAANPHSRVLAVEPAQENWELLEQNLAPLTSQGRAKVARAAVWDADRDLTGFLPGPKIYSSFTVTEGAGSDGAPAVQGRTLPSLLGDAGFDEVDLLKVDIEGAEVPLLRTAAAWLHRIRTLAIEFHGTARADSNFDALMKEHHFDILESGGHTVVARSRRPPAQPQPPG